jgi:hypothetical protein
MGVAKRFAYPESPLFSGRARLKQGAPLCQRSVVCQANAGTQAELRSIAD